MGGGPRFAAGDALRALAALSVLAFHVAVGVALTHGSPDGSGNWNETFGAVAGRVLANLDAGLWVFFVLSGYLVGGPFVRAIVGGRPLPAVMPYLGRRARRIIPAFWVITALLVLRHGTLGSSPAELVAVFGFAQTFDPSPFSQRMAAQAWTLHVELVFYVVLPALAALIFVLVRRVAWQRDRIAWLAGGLLALGAGSLALRWQADFSGAFARSFPALLYAFVPGLLLAAVEPLAAPALKGRRGRVLSGALLVASAGAMVLLCTVVARQGVGRPVALMTVASGLVAGALVWQWATGGAPRLVVSRPVTALGRWSYGIYLVHIGVAAEVLALLPDELSPTEALVVALAATVPASIAAAALSWRVVERPALTREWPLRGRLWARERPAKVAQADAMAP